LEENINPSVNIEM